MSTDDSDEDELDAYIAAWEEQEPRSLLEVLPESGVPLPSPDELDEAALTSKLWEVIHVLALLGAFLHSTDHLSDRQLYTRLRDDLLREPAVLMPEISAYAWHIDVLGSGSEEDVFLHLKYYADEEERRRWQEDWPSGPLPDPEKPPYDRDRHLPQAESRIDGPVM